MAAVLMTGSIKDFSFTSMTDYNVRIGFFPSDTGTRGEFLFPTMPKWVEPDQLGSFSVRLEATAGLVPQVWYTVKFEWLDKAGNFVSMDTPDWVLVVPAGGGTVAANIAEVKPDRIITKGEPGDSSPATLAAAKEAARQAIIDEQLVRQDDPRLLIKGGTGTLHSFPDANYRETWLGTRAEDGGPTELSMWHLQNRLGTITHGDPNILAGFLDAAFRYTELIVDRAGRVPDSVLNTWKARMGGGIGGGAGLAHGDRYVNADGTLSSVFPDVKNITIWGSSSAERIGTALGQALAGTGATFHNQGKGAETSQHISARLGSVPALLTVVGGSIPASGSVTVTASNMGNSVEMKPFTGTLNGVHGELTSTATVFTFTRTTAGAATPVPAGTPFIPTVGTASRQHVTLLWGGKNNLSGAGSAPLVTTQTNLAFDYLSPLVKRVLVLGHFVDTAQSAGSTQHTNVNTVNAALAARYGDLFLDVSGYLSSPQLWTDTGITPTANDLTQQAAGIKPDSISHDSGHLNAAGYTAVSALIRKKLVSLGWY